MLDPDVQDQPMRRLLRREYDELVARGFFADERIELLRGVLVEMSPQGAAHASISEWLHELFVRALPAGQCRVRSHSPFAATDDSEPEPDVIVAPRVAGDWAHPTQALLLVEVTLDSLRKDRRLKLGIYAEAGVPEYWIVDIDGGQIEVYTQPEGRAYLRCERFGRSALLRPTRLPGVEISLAGLPWDAPRR